MYMIDVVRRDDTFFYVWIQNYINDDETGRHSSLSAGDIATERGLAGVRFENQAGGKCLGGDLGFVRELKAIRR